jgi:hypothetical protein
MIANIWFLAGVKGFAHVLGRKVGFAWHLKPEKRKEIQEIKGIYIGMKNAFAFRMHHP